MIWLALRRRRLVLLLWFAGCAALLVYMVVVGHAIQAVLHTRQCLSGGVSHDGSRIVCSGEVLILSKQSQFIFGLLVGLPALGGLLFGAPLVADEYERRTNRIVWTQGVSRTRWLTTQSVVAAVVVLLPIVAIAAIMPWWRTTPTTTNFFTRGMNPAVFGISGFVMIGYSLFALALASFLGALFRRIIAAVLVTPIVFWLTRLSVQQYWRPWLLAPLRQRAPLFNVSHAWLVGSSFLTTARRLAVSQRCHFHYANVRQVTACIRNHHASTYIFYQPADRFWAFQGLETAIFLGFAGVLFAGTIWVVHRWRA